VERTRDDALEQLALPEDDLGLRPQATRDVVEALDRLAEVNEPPEQPRTPREERPRDGKERGKSERARENRYVPLTFLISAEMAGRISCRSPMTA